MKNKFLTIITSLTLALAMTASLTIGMSTPVRAAEAEIPTADTRSIVDIETASADACSSIEDEAGDPANDAPALDISDDELLTREKLQEKMSLALQAKIANTYQASLNSLTDGAPAGITIALDPGHGGTDSGACSGDLKESDINYTIATYLKKYLESFPGITVYMTRDKNSLPGLAERVEGAVDAGADLFISLHNDSAPNKEANGSTVYYPNKSYRPTLHTEGAALGQAILDELEQLGLKNNGLKIRDSESKSTYPDDSISDYYGIIRNGKLQGITAIIVEHAYVSNAADRENYLTKDDKLKEIAHADGRGIAAYLGLVGSVTEGVVAGSKGYACAAELSLAAVPGGATYDIYRSKKPSEDFKLIDTVHYTPTDYTEVPVYDEWGNFLYNEYIGLNSYVYTDEGLTMDSHYYYQVVATTADGTVSRSNTVSVSTAVKLDMEVAALGTGNLTLDWKAQKGVRGYYIYRATTKKGTYERIAKILGEGENIYADEGLELNKYYYYYITAFTKKDGKVIESVPSEIKRNYTFATPEITSIKEGSAGNLTLKWSKVEGAQTYVIYRKSVLDSDYEVLDEVDSDETSYKDADVVQGTTYEYKVLAAVYLRATTGISDSSEPVTVTAVASPELKPTHFNDKGFVTVKWYKSKGASGYEIQRAAGDGAYTTVATIKGETKKKYKDKTAIIGGEYSYRVRALNNTGIITGATSYEYTDDITVMFTPEIGEAVIDTQKTGMKITWSDSHTVDGYIIYRRNADTDDAKYKKIKKITDLKKYVVDSGAIGNTTESGETKAAGTAYAFTDTAETEPGESFAYVIEAYVSTEEFGLVKSEKTVEVLVTAGYPIMGTSKTTVDQMVTFFVNKGKPYPADVYTDYGAPTIEDFATIVYEEAEAEGLRAEVVFAQICKETGFLQFGGDVQPNQCNFAGIGATGGGVPGNSFTDVREGVRAQVQHLKAYASDEDLVNQCVDPRFSFVKRLQSIYVEWLGINENPNGGGWAAALRYGYSLRDDYIAPLLNS